MINGLLFKLSHHLNPFGMVVNCYHLSALILLSSYI